MNTVGHRLAKARERKKLSQKKLAELVGVSREAISQWEADVSEPLKKWHPALAKHLDVPPSTFSAYGGGTVESLTGNVAKTVIILLQWSQLRHVRLGRIDMSGLKNPEYLEVDKVIGEDSFAFVIQDESMVPTFWPSDEVVVRLSLKPEKDDCVVVRIKASGEHLFRTYVPRATGAYDLVPESAEWPTVTINNSNPAELLGVMVEHRRKRRIKKT